MTKTMKKTMTNTMAKTITIPDTHYRFENALVSAAQALHLKCTWNAMNNIAEKTIAKTKTITMTVTMTMTDSQNRSGNVSVQWNALECNAK